jgi:hypothetical protein
MPGRAPGAADPAASAVALPAGGGATLLVCIASSSVPFAHPPATTSHAKIPTHDPIRPALRHPIVHLQRTTTRAYPA